MKEKEGTVLLTAEERREIAAELARYPDPRAASVDALKIVQRHRGWVSDEALKEVAGVIGMTPHELDAVATFYNLVFRRPVGQHVVLFCDSVSCWVMGCERLAARLSERMGIRPGQTTADGRFTLLPNPCLGACDGAPALMIDADLHQRVAPDAVDALLARYPRKGER